jgi:Nickel responsive protein SCO4226-like
MPRFVTVHRAPGLSREEFQANAAAVLECKYALFEHMYVDMFSGFIVTVYEASDQAALEREFERLGFPWDEVHEIQISGDLATLRQINAARAS